MFDYFNSADYFIAPSQTYSHSRAMRLGDRDDEPRNMLFSEPRVTMANPFSYTYDRSSNDFCQDRLNDYRHAIRECAMKAKRLAAQQEAYISGCVECMNKLVATTFSAKYALQLENEFNSKGYESPIVVQFLKDVKSCLLFGGLTEEDIATHNIKVECMEFPNSKLHYDSENHTFCQSHFFITFREKTSGRLFSIGIPVRDNTSFSWDMIDDAHHGRFLLCYIKENEQYAKDPMRYGSGNEVETTCLIAEFQSSKFAQEVAKFFTNFDLLSKRIIYSSSHLYNEQLTFWT